MCVCESCIPFRRIANNKSSDTKRVVFIHNLTALPDEVYYVCRYIRQTYSLDVKYRHKTCGGGGGGVCVGG